MLEVSYARRQCNSHTLVAVNQNPRLAAVLENVLAEVLETNNCVRYQPLSTHFFFLTSYVVKWWSGKGTQRVSFLHGATVVLRKSTCPAVCVVHWPSAFYMEYYFCLKKGLVDKLLFENMVIQIWVFVRHFLKIEWNKFAILRNTTDCIFFFLPVIKSKHSSEN